MKKRKINGAVVFTETTPIRFCKHPSHHPTGQPSPSPNPNPNPSSLSPLSLSLYIYIYISLPAATSPPLVPALRRSLFLSDPSCGPADGRPQRYGGGVVTRSPIRRLSAGRAAPHAAERWDRRGGGPFHGRRCYARWAYAMHGVERGSARGGVGGGGAYPPAVRHPMLLAGGPPLGSARLPGSRGFRLRRRAPAPRPRWGQGLPRRRRPQGGAQCGAGALAAAEQANAKLMRELAPGGGEVVGQAAGTQLRDGVQGPRADGGGAGAPPVLQPRTRRGRPASTICSELKARGAPRRGPFPTVTFLQCIYALLLLCPPLAGRHRPQIWCRRFHGQCPYCVW